MPKLTPAQHSFSAGEISPLMYNRSDTEGYKQGVSQLLNMFPDSRGAAKSRGGSHFIEDFTGNNARIIAIPVNDKFFYSAIMLKQKLVIGSMIGHNPSVLYNSNANFNLNSQGWTYNTDGDSTSTVIFVDGQVTMDLAGQNNRWAYITQQFTMPATGDYRLLWNIETSGANVKIGTTEDSGDVYDSGLTTIVEGDIVFIAPQTTLWMTIRIDASQNNPSDATVKYFGITDTTLGKVEFVTPYLEEHLDGLQAVQSPQGAAIYILHESYPVYKLSYDRQTDAFTWGQVSFVNPPPQWTTGSYPSAGDFFQGRLWLGGTVNEPQTFWASKSGLPEDFTQGIAADDGLEFTMAKYGRIEWMVGFKNLVIGTQNAEHIVTSEGGIIRPDDIKVEQQSSYGSANIQPVQVGDQIFYVSADRRKLRAIQYEWQKDNWLSKDLTFNSEHITESGIRHVAWQQNPNNLFHCVLEDGTVATLTYERSREVYGWSKLQIGVGKVIDITAGAIEGTDVLNGIVQYDTGNLYFETQTPTEHIHFMDSWVDRALASDGVTVTELEHLEGKTVQVLVDGAVHPDRVVQNGKITIQGTGGSLSSSGETVVTVGLKYNTYLVTLPLNRQISSGSSESYMKRWNKIYIMVLNSAMPLINGERAPERHPQTPMNTPEPPTNEEILKVNMGHDRNQTVRIEQDLPHNLVVLGLFGEIGQSIL